MSIRRPQEVDSKFIHSMFTDLRLIDQKITKIDPSMRKLSKLKKLSLINTEKVKAINFDNLPRTLEALNFIACGLSGLRESIQNSFLKGKFGTYLPWIWYEISKTITLNSMKIINKKLLKAISQYCALMSCNEQTEVRSDGWISYNWVLSKFSQVHLKISVIS